MSAPRDKHSKEEDTVIYTSHSNTTARWELWGPRITIQEHKGIETACRAQSSPPNSGGEESNVDRAS